jgi:hypothetical protein
MSNGNATETARPACAVRHPNRDICPSLQWFGRYGARQVAGRWRDVHAVPVNPAIDRSPMDLWQPSRRRVATDEDIHGITERRRLRQTDLEGEGPAKAAAGTGVRELHAHLASDAARVRRIAWQRGVAYERGAFQIWKRATERSRDGGIER